MSLLDGLPIAAGRTTDASAEAFLWQFGGPRPAASGSAFLVEEADEEAVAAYAALRHRVFVEEQAIFIGSDRDDLDGDPRTVVLVARDHGGRVYGGVRLAPVSTVALGDGGVVVAGDELGWWVGSRLVVSPGSPPRTGAALVRAACARAEAEGALRFDALVQADKERFFARLGWLSRGTVDHLGHPHVRMRWPIGLIAGQAAAKQVIAEVLGDLRPGGEGFVGDDGAPVPASDLVAATDAVLPSMVERDPWWAGWCSVLVNVNDLAAMGALPVGLLDSVAAPSPSLAKRVMAGLTAAAERYGVPVLGGHTQANAPCALTVTMLGRAARPVPGGGGRPGDRVSVIADLAGGWRPGYGGRQWDSTTRRSADDLRRLASTLHRVQVHAAKDVSMAGLVGTLGMLAEASGCGAELDVASVPRPDEARLADWFTCFPGFALVVAGDRPVRSADVAPATVATCGRLLDRPGVTLVWPDGERTRVLDGPVVGLGRSDQASLPGAENRGLRPFRVAPSRRAAGTPGLGEVLTGPRPERRPRASSGATLRADVGSDRPPVSRPGQLAHALGRDEAGPAEPQPSPAAPPPRRATGWAFRSAAEGATFAGAQSARSPGSEAVRGFVGGPFPSVAPAAQVARPPRPRGWRPDDDAATGGGPDADSRPDPTAGTRGDGAPADADRAGDIDPAVDGIAEMGAPPPAAPPAASPGPAEAAEAAWAARASGAQRQADRRDPAGGAEGPAAGPAGEGA
jgi:putative N-acetyltransferase (TIGR04045 family)